MQNPKLLLVPAASVSVFVLASLAACGGQIVHDGAVDAGVGHVLTDSGSGAHTDTGTATGSRPGTTALTTPDAANACVSAGGFCGAFEGPGLGPCGGDIRSPLSCAPAEGVCCLRGGSDSGTDAGGIDAASGGGESTMDAAPSADSGSVTLGLPPDSGGVECLTPGDCEALLGVRPSFCEGSCPNAPNGGCQHYLCLAGICQTSFCATQPANPPVSPCTTPTDCEALLGVLPSFCEGSCPDAPNGGCQHYVCLAGICQTTFCASQPAAPPASECATAADCDALLGVLPSFCEGSCPHAPNGGCEHYVCLAGVCQTSFCK